MKIIYIPTTCGFLQRVPIEEVIRAADFHGSHFFSAGAKRFFDSRHASIAYRGPKGLFFATTERSPWGVRSASVRRVRYHYRSFRIDTIGTFGGYGTMALASAAARRFAQKGVPLA